MLKKKKPLSEPQASTNLFAGGGFSICKKQNKVKDNKTSYAYGKFFRKNGIPDHRDYHIYKSIELNEKHLANSTFNKC